MSGSTRWTTGGSRGAWRSAWSALERLLERPGFGTGPATVGAELELFLVDGQGRALPLNQAVRDETADPRVVLEIDRFNLELNLTPAPLAGRPFAAFASELDQALGIVRRAAAWHGGRIAMVGILPTLRAEELRLAAISDAARYRALNNGIRRLRQEPFRIRIDGADPLELAADDVGLEGANTSFQLHLRVDPDRFTAHFNAAQLATGPALAAAGNSPTFLGHRLWEETRVALFKQAVDDRDTAGRSSRRVSPGRLRDRLGPQRRLGAAGGERAAARAGAARARPGTAAGPAGGGRGPRPGGAAPAPEHGVALEPGHLRPRRRRPCSHRGCGPCPPGRRWPTCAPTPPSPSASPWPWPPTPTPGSAGSPSSRPTTTSTGPPSWASGPSWPGRWGPAAGW